MRKKDIGYKKILSEASYSSFGLKNKKSVFNYELNEAGPAYDYRKKTKWAYSGRNTSDAPYNQLKDGIPTAIMDYILHNEWKFLDAEMTDIIDFAVTLPRNLVSEFRLKGNVVYIAVILSGDMSRETVVSQYNYAPSTKEDAVWRIGISMRKTGDRVGRPGKYTYEFSREDSNKFKNIGYLFYRAEREVNSVVDSGRDKKTYLIDPRETTLVRRGNYWGGESRKRYPVRGRRMSESDDVNDLSKYSKQEFVDYMVEHDIYSWAAAEMIYDHITDIEGSFILSDILKTYSEFDNYLDALSDSEVDMDVDDTEDFSDVELEEEAKSLVRGQYDVLETKEGSIVVIGDY
ncbi:MAG: hypothetical protein EOM67_14100 [Spirochaetia bacterium]|nr:hypothetical protein [Spirochaetia bacterium]